MIISRIGIYLHPCIRQFAKFVDVEQSSYLNVSLQTKLVYKSFPRTNTILINQKQNSLKFQKSNIETAQSTVGCTNHGIKFSIFNTGNWS